MNNVSVAQGKKIRGIFSLGVSNINIFEVTCSRKKESGVVTGVEGKRRVRRRVDCETIVIP